MDRYLEFADKSACEIACAVMDEAYFERCEALGYTVVTERGKKRVIPKNLATGMDDPSASGATSWGKPQQGLDGKFYLRTFDHNPNLAPLMKKLSVQALGKTVTKQREDFIGFLTP